MLVSTLLAWHIPYKPRAEPVAKAEWKHDVQIDPRSALTQSFQPHIAGSVCARVPHANTIVLTPLVLLTRSRLPLTSNHPKAALM